ncbi:GDSL-type esterase/lipase family protein [Streptomyces sp. NPDC001770]
MTRHGTDRPDALRFLFVGDSMTVGRAGDFTWRHRMWQHLEATLGEGGYAIVGPRTGLYDAEADAAVSTAYADPSFPAPARRHLSGWGEGWLHMAPVIEEAVRTSRADVLLVSLGLIDLGFYTDSEQTAANARAFIAAARAANPHVRLVLLPVIPNIRAESDAPFADACARFNALLAEAVADLSTSGSPVLLTAHPSGYDIHTDTYDGTHPGPSGEHKLAAAFADALHGAWSIGGRYTPEPEQAGVPGPGEAAVPEPGRTLVPEPAL